MDHGQSVESGRGTVVDVFARSRAQSRREQRSSADAPMSSGRDRRFAEAKARMHEHISRWLEQNDPDVFFGHISHARRMARILDLTRDVRGSVLDVGPFAGVLAERIIAQGDKEVYGIDSDETALCMAAKRGVLPVFADIEEEGIQCADATFDAVVMGDVLSYFIEPDFVLSEIHRVLKPGGKFILSTPNLASLGNRLLALMGHVPYEMDVRPYGGGYQRYYTMHSLRQLLNEHGFEVVSMETNFVHLPVHRLPVTWRFFRKEPGANRHRFWYWHWLARVMPRLGEDLIVLARRGRGRAGA